MPIPISKKANRLNLNITEIGEVSKEDNSSSCIDESVSSKRSFETE